MNYIVKNNGQQILVRTCTVLEKPYNKPSAMEYILFKLNGPAELEITSEIEIQEAVIRPLHANIPFQLRDGKVFVTLDHPQKFSLEINGSFYHNLVVFAEADKYGDFDKTAENVIYFPAGVHEIDTYFVQQDNTIIYLDDDAILHGRIEARSCSNLEICGYGKITMEGIERDPEHPDYKCVDLFHCTKLILRDFVIDDSNNWSCRLTGCTDVLVDNLKIFGWRGNSDGVDVCGSRNVLVQNIFTRVWDDSFVIKAFDTGNGEKIVFRDSILWNDFARPIEVGVEIRADRLSHVRFENIDILHSTTGYPVIGIHHGDRALVSDIVFDRIRIEDAPGAQLFDARITNSVWNRDETMGRIENLTLSNIDYIGYPGAEYLLSRPRLQGFDNVHDIRNVKFHNIRILGKMASTAEELGLFCMNANNVQVTADIDQPVLGRIGVTIQTALSWNEAGKYKGTAAVTLTNQGNEQHSGSAWLNVSPKNIISLPEFSFDLAPGEAMQRSFDIALPPGKYVVSIQSKDMAVENNWEFIDLAWKLPRTEAVKAEPRIDFVNYYGDCLEGVRASIWKNELLIDADFLQYPQNSLVLYTANPVPVEQGEVRFTVEETDFGEAPAVVLGREGLEAAPQLRCPGEITYVFKNKPKVDKIYKYELKNTYARISLKDLGIPDGAKSFLLEVQAKTPVAEKYRYPFTLFHSVTPQSTAHMFVLVEIPE